jgi:hypothetical protein
VTGVVSVAPQQYALESSAAEIARLDAQAVSIAPATALLLRAAGITPGTRVLDLGTKRRSRGSCGRCGMRPPTR